MKRGAILNNRPITFSAVALAIGVFIGALIINSFIAFIVLIAFGIVFSAVGVYTRKSTVTAIFSFFSLGLCIFFTYASIVAPVDVNRDYAVVSGRVKAISSATEEVKGYVLEELSLDGERVKGKAYLNVAETFEVGDLVSAGGKVENVEFNPFSGYSVSRYEGGISYQCDAVYAVKEGESKLTLTETVRVKIKNVYLKYLGQEDGAVALGLVLGDVAYMSKNTVENTRASGVYHIFSVSGLHVGILVMCIMFVCDYILRLAKKKSFVVTLVILLLYGALTGFPVGVVRASIMCLISATALIVERPYDPLNALSLTVIVILLCSPLSLFSLSFLLSIASVFGIVCFYEAIKKAVYTQNPLRRNLAIRIINKFFISTWSGVAVSVSATSFVVVISSYFFGTLNLYAIVTNLIVGPLTTLVYTVLVPLTFLPLIYEPLGIVLSWISIPSAVIRAFSAFVASLPFSTISLSLPSASAFLYSVGLISLTRYLKIKTRYKILVALTCFIACVGIFFIF